jgi:UDP-N-acetylmuramyl tripeptide synthase
LSIGAANDIILIAGKGMKPIKKMRHDFDDMKIVKEF